MMHDSVKQSAAPAQQGRSPSENMFNFNNHFIPSPDSVQIKVEPRDYPHRPSIGLEVIHLPVTQSISVHGWQDQHIPGTTTCYSTAVSAPEYGSLPYYPPQYATPTLVDTTSIQYPAFTSSAQAQPLYYTSNYNTNQNGSPEFGQTATRRWPMTPQSHISTPERIAKQEPHRTSPTENTWPSPIVINETLQSKESISYINANLSFEQTKAVALKRSPSPHDTESTSGSDSPQMSFDGSISPGPSTTEARKGCQKKSNTPEDARHDSDANLCCQICGKKFTRRSNCREHIKRHNPENRKVYSCNSCRRTFGRKTDLKRHYLARIHDGEKKFICNICGRGYSRPDTLHRHKKDGCPEKRRQEAAAAKKLQDPEHEYEYSEYNPLE